MPTSSREMQERYASEQYEYLKRIEACMQRLLTEMRDVKATLARVEAQTVGPFQRLEVRPEVKENR